MPVPEAAAVGFDRGADDYEKGRPGFAPEVFELLGRELGIGAGRRVCDLAAGTGKFTRGLIGLGADVVAVEPVEGMRRQFGAALPDVELLDGTAEAIPLADESVDAFTVAQAFHWFDPPSRWRRSVECCGRPVAWPWCGTAGTSRFRGSPRCPPCSVGTSSRTRRTTRRTGRPRSRRPAASPRSCRPRCRTRRK